MSLARPDGGVDIIMIDKMIASQTPAFVGLEGHDAIFAAGEQRNSEHYPINNSSVRSAIGPTT